MRAPLLLAALLLPLMAAAPPVFTPTAEETKQLDKGDIAIRHESTATGAGIIAMARVNAPPRTVIDAVMDLEARVNEIGSLQSMERYLNEPSPERIGAKWTLSVLGSTVVFHIRYDCDRANGHCTYHLDPSKKNDIVASEGHYIVRPDGAGTLLFYTSRMDSGRSMPGWLRRWIAGSSLQQQVQGIIDRAQAAQ